MRGGLIFLYLGRDDIYDGGGNAYHYQGHDGADDAPLHACLYLLIADVPGEGGAGARHDDGDY